jgi:crotonobetainyl-CoA:carnitine CoA-transferase CaiB-like acyl-CoA transferase
VLDRLGLGYDVLRAKNPRLVFCSISGLGTWGPYHELGSHGPSFDAFGGLSSINPYNLTADEQRDLQSVPVGMHAMGLHAALGTLAAYIRARRTGEGAVIEVAAADSSAHWRPDGVDTVLNADLVHERPGFKNSHGRMAGWPRLQRYDTRDGRGVFFQALSPKFWVRFCEAVSRPDLLALTQGAGEADQGEHLERVAVRLIGSGHCALLEHPARFDERLRLVQVVRISMDDLVPGLSQQGQKRDQEDRQSHHRIQTTRVSLDGHGHPALTLILSDPQ